MSQLKSYRQLIRMYRGVYESEAGVGLQNRVPSEIVETLEKLLSEVEKPKKRNTKTKRQKKPE